MGDDDYNAFLQDMQSQEVEKDDEKFSAEDLLCFLSVMDLSVEKYENFRALIGPDKVLSYRSLSKYRDTVLPPTENSPNKVEVSLKCR